MNILIVILISLLVLAGVGAGVYMFVFKKSKSKKVGDSQDLNLSNIPTYGTGPDPAQSDQSQAPSFFNNTANQSQGQDTTLGSPVMTDITGQSSPASAAPEMPQTPQAPELPSNNMPGQPTVNHDFPSESTDNPLENSVNNADANIPPADTTTGNILDDDTTMTPVTEMKADEDLTSGVMNDFSVPVTKTEEAATPQPEFTPASPEPVAQPETSTVQDFPIGDQPTEPQTAPSMTVPEAPVMPEVNIPTDIPAPQASTENPVPTPSNTGIEEDAGTQEMKI